MTTANPLGDLGKLLVVAGIALVAAGLLLLAGGRLPLRFGRLPGDISYQGPRGSFYFPIVTCIVISAIFTLVLWIINYLRR